MSSFESEWARKRSVEVRDSEVQKYHDLLERIKKRIEAVWELPSIAAELRKTEEGENMANTELVQVLMQWPVEQFEEWLDSSTISASNIRFAVAMHQALHLKTQNISQPTEK